ncbi:hypothetical protein [Amycolatopsis australiensis]|uniref:Uncharacterized protein n=1 Tax=Amycolatopsis australiensis TaxID=546364 RepID=A0A1K1Q732_9PSEU|nr:hypothetical protein [Amycolatopsis australiensis]SFW55525.1 hypothetical protein SAMN04489730_1422 [Amycolatopsis australiensis]
MGKIERRVLAAALLGAVAMFGVVGFTRGEEPAAPALGVPVAAESHFRVTSSAGVPAEVVVQQGNPDFFLSSWTGRRS